MVGIFVAGIIGLRLWLNKGRSVEAAWFNDSWGSVILCRIQLTLPLRQMCTCRLRLIPPQIFSLTVETCGGLTKEGICCPITFFQVVEGRSTVTYVFLKSFPAGAQIFYYWSQPTTAR